MATRQRVGPSKPPLGLTPKRIHDEQRISAILNAMDRYAAADKPAPTQWVSELHGLVAGLTDQLAQNRKVKR